MSNVERQISHTWCQVEAVRTGQVLANKKELIVHQRPGETNLEKVLNSDPKPLSIAILSPKQSKVAKISIPDLAPFTDIHRTGPRTGAPYKEPSHRVFHTMPCQELF
jgi:hypothetical protein